MSLESATHIAFPFLNSFPLSNHISGVPGCFLNFVQIWIRFGILPEIKSNLALKLAVVHFAAHVWITNFLVKRTSWYYPTKKTFAQLFPKFGETVWPPRFFKLCMLFFQKTRFLPAFPNSFECEYDSEYFRKSNQIFHWSWQSYIFNTRLNHQFSCGTDFVGLSKKTSIWSCFFRNLAKRFGFP